MIVGDLDAYVMEDPIVALVEAGYTDLIDQVIGPTAYSYPFDGQLGYLDHALANASLTDQVTGAAAWHINADEVPLFDYNDGILDAGERPFDRESGALPIYAADPLRSSDHDPVLVGLDLDPIPENPTRNGLPATILGTQLDDVIVGTDGDEVIVTLDGDDTITSGDGDDTVDAGDGDDTVRGGNGRDTVDAGGGNDEILGGNGKDLLNAGDGSGDVVDGGRAKDRCLNAESESSCELDS